MGMAARRKRGEGSISFDHRGPCSDPGFHRGCPGRWRAEVSRGYDVNGRRIKSKVTSTDRARLLAKLEDLREDLGSGADDQAVTLRRAIDRWLAEGLDGRSPKTIKRNRALFYSAENPDELRPEFSAIGKTKLRELKAAEVREALSAAARTRSAATVALMHNCLTRAIRHAQADDLVHRNVAEFIDTPTGQAVGRPSKSLTLQQAAAVIAAAQAPPEVQLHPGLRDFRRPPALMHAYIMLCLLVGVRAEEARALRWHHVVTFAQDSGRWLPVTEAGWEHDSFAVCVWRSVRARGDTKTERSRRTLALPRLAAAALAALWQLTEDEQRAAAGKRIDTGLVFTTALGTVMDAGNLRRMFRRTCKDAGIGEDWTPRELRHTFVSLLSDSGMRIEEIADLVGHASSRTTETVYRHQLRPVIQTGASVMDGLFPTATTE